MLGLGLALSIGKRVLGDAIDSLLSALRGRATYYENGSASKSTIKAIDDADILDKASILLTPTATSNARVHSVKTYTGDELVTNGTFDADSNWTKGTGWSISDGKVIAVSGSTSKLEQSISNLSGKTCKVTFTLSDYGGSGAVIVDFGSTTSANINTNGEHTVFGTYDINEFELLKGSGFSGAIDNISVVDVSSDFDFDRASSATRINSDGLVQDMQSITDPELVLNGDFEELGDDLVTNGGFDSDSDWTKLNATISGGKGNLDGDGQTSLLYQGILTNGKTYKVTFTVSDYNNLGEARIIDDNGDTKYTITSDGTFTVYFTHNVATSNFYFRARSGAVFSIDNVSVQQVDPNDRWTLGTGWSIEDGKLVGDGTNTSFSSAQQSNLTVSGNTYQVTLTIEAVSGAIELKGAGFYTRVDTLGVGTHTLTFVADATYFRFLAHAGATATIDNISVKDITFSEEVDLARINHDSNGENGHILLEPTSTNLVPYSEDFSGYIKTGTTLTPNAITSPNGQNNATKNIADTTTLQHNAYTTFSNSGATSFSVFAKASEYDYAQLYGGGSTGNRFSVVVNLTNGTIDTYDNINTNQISIQSFPNDWYRIIVNGFDNTNTFVAIAPIKESGLSRDAGLDIDYTGDNTSGVYFFGLQVEALPYATSYIPTLTGSTVTRATETLTGSGNSTLINSTEGVLYAEIAALANDGTSRAICISDGTNTHRALISYNATTNQIQAFHNDGSSPLSLFYTVSNVDDFHKVAFKYKLNDFALWIDGVEVDTSSLGGTNTANTFNQLAFENATGSSDFYGKCKSLAVFNEALSDDELENLTS